MIELNLEQGIHNAFGQWPTLLTYSILEAESDVLYVPIFLHTLWLCSKPHR